MEASGDDCQLAAGTVTYRLIAGNNEGQESTQNESVIVGDAAGCANQHACAAAGDGYVRATPANQHACAAAGDGYVRATAADQHACAAAGDGHDRS